MPERNCYASSLFGLLRSCIMHSIRRGMFILQCFECKTHPLGVCGFAFFVFISLLLLLLFKLNFRTKVPIDASKKTDTKISIPSSLYQINHSMMFSVLFRLGQFPVQQTEIKFDLSRNFYFWFGIGWGRSPRCGCLSWIKNGLKASPKSTDNHYRMFPN